VTAKGLGNSDSELGAGPPSCTPSGSGCSGCSWAAGGGSEIDPGACQDSRLALLPLPPPPPATDWKLRPPKPRAARLSGPAALAPGLAWM
jgi:hypothetical protein